MDSSIGKALIMIGLVIVFIGLIIYFFNGKLHWLGHLPGDIRIERENFRFYFPVTTIILLNILLFIIVRIWQWLR